MIQYTRQLAISRYLNSQLGEAPGVYMTSLHLNDNTTESDRASISARLDAYRERELNPATPLLVSPDGEAASAPPAIPAISAAALNIDSLRDAINNHGCLVVRGLFPAEEVRSLPAVIDRVLSNCDEFAAGSTPTDNACFAPPHNLAEIMPRGERELGNTRSFHRESGSAMCVEAPTVAEELLRWYESHGLKALLTEYLGEAPCLSAKKWVLRRSKLPVSEAGWHQDGAFMGTDINSLNLWLPLNRCGGTTGAPGLDILPQRLTRIVSAEGAQFDWSVSSAQTERLSDSAEVLNPEFEEGDALFFDHFFLHRTQFGDSFETLRYAVETWFFGATRFPKNQIPLAW